MSEIRVNKIGTNLKVIDFEASKRFYDALGFQKLYDFGPGGDTDEKYRGIVYAVGNAFLEVTEGHRPIKPEVFEARIDSSKISLMVNVDSLIPVLDACEAHGIAIAVPPRQHPWGTIEFIVVDPDGFVIGFNAEVSDEEAQAVQARTDVPLLRDEPDYTDGHVASIQKRTAAS